MKQPEKGTKGVNRRTFCQLTGTSACLLAGAGAALLSGEYLRPRVLFEPPTRVTVGLPDTVPKGTVLVDEDYRLYVMHLDDGFRAMSAVCTHLGCVTRYSPEDRLIRCPCHGSRFNIDGEVVAGPAPRPLRWLEMDLDSEGLITVDSALEVPQGTVYKL